MCGVGFKTGTPRWAMPGNSWKNRPQAKGGIIDVWIISAFFKGMQLENVYNENLYVDNEILKLYSKWCLTFNRLRNLTHQCLKSYLAPYSQVGKQCLEPGTGDPRIQCFMAIGYILNINSRILSYYILLQVTVASVIWQTHAKGNHNQQLYIFDFTE